MEEEATVMSTMKDVGMGALQETKNVLHLDELAGYLTWGNFAKVLTSIIAILIFYIFYRVIKSLINKRASQKLSPKAVSIISKAVSYTFYVLMVMYVLGLFGIKLSAIWGAAGIAGVAIGFAAQTSVSNLISGIFVVTEKTMKKGDFIEIDGVSGTVDSIGPLSVKIHTLDNQMYRIPNATIINNKLQNFSAFKYRRLVFDLSVDYATDLDKCLEVLSHVPEYCPTVVTDKKGYESSVVLVKLLDSGIDINVNVWFERQDLIQTRTDVCKAIIKLCRENDINIPFNRMDVTVLSDQTNPKASGL